MKEQETNRYTIMPGQMVSEDHYTSWDKGSLYQKKGNSAQSDMFSGGCVFVEHVISFMISKNQVAINNTETVKDKITFEREAKIQGVAIK